MDKVVGGCGGCWVVWCLLSFSCVSFSLGAMLGFVLRLVGSQLFGSRWWQVALVVWHCMGAIFMTINSCSFPVRKLALSRPKPRFRQRLDAGGGLRGCHGGDAVDGTLGGHAGEDQSHAGWLEGLECRLEAYFVEKETAMFKEVSVKSVRDSCLFT